MGHHEQNVHTEKEYFFQSTHLWKTKCIYFKPLENDISAQQETQNKTCFEAKANWKKKSIYFLQAITIGEEIPE